MNPDTGELRSIGNEAEMMAAKQGGLYEVPTNLNYAARRKLNGRKRAMVSLTSGGKLSKHAAYLRKQKKKKAANKRAGN